MYKIDQDLCYSQNIHFQICVSSTRAATVKTSEFGPQLCLLGSQSEFMETWRSHNPLKDCFDNNKIQVVFSCGDICIDCRIGGMYL